MRRVLLVLLVILVLLLMGRLAATRIGFGAGYPWTPPDPPSSVIELSAAPDYAWTWFGEPRMLEHADHLYFGGVDTSGNVAVRVRPPGGPVGSEIILKAAYDIDDHVNPSLWVRPDGKLQAFYARHSPNEGTMRTRVSVNTLAADPTLSGGFAAEVSLDSVLMATTYDYPVPITLSGESKTYLFWRSVPVGDRGSLVYSTTTDGDTWTQAVPLYVNLTKTQRAYWKIATNGVDRIDFAVTDGSPNTDTTHLAHFYYDGAWRQSDGTDMGTKPSGGFAFADFTPVWTSSNTWVYDISYLSGEPVIVHPTYPTPFSHHRYHYSYWDGAAWQIETMVSDAGNGIDSATRVYSAGIAIDRVDPEIVYAGIENGGTSEIVRLTRTAPNTWSSEAITSGSSAMNMRPAAVWGADAGSEVRVGWMYGQYTGWDAGLFNTGLRGSP